MLFRSRPQHILDNLTRLGIHLYDSLCGLTENAIAQSMDFVGRVVDFAFIEGEFSGHRFWATMKIGTDRADKTSDYNFSRSRFEMSTSAWLASVMIL